MLNIFVDIFFDSSEERSETSERRNRKVKEIEKFLRGDLGTSTEKRKNSSDLRNLSSEVLFHSSEVLFPSSVENFHFPPDGFQIPREEIGETRESPRELTTSHFESPLSQPCISTLFVVNLQISYRLTKKESALPQTLSP